MFWLTFWFGTFAMLFFELVGVLFIMKTLKNEWYVVKANKFTAFEIFYYHILCVHAIPTLESTNSIINAGITVYSMYYGV